jgi:hypothetical protein
MTTIDFVTHKNTKIENFMYFQNIRATWNQATPARRISGDLERRNR